MPRAAKPRKATAAKATKPRKSAKPRADAAKKKPAAPAPRKRVKFQPTSGETLKENATQLEIAERMLAELASRDQAETDPAVAAQRALRSAILTGAVSPSSIVLKPAAAMTRRTPEDLKAEADAAAAKPAADAAAAAAKAAAKVAAKAARDAALSQDIAAELARILPASGGPSLAPSLAPSPAAAAAKAAAKATAKATRDAELSKLIAAELARALVAAAPVVMTGAPSYPTGPAPAPRSPTSPSGGPPPPASPSGGPPPPPGAPAAPAKPAGPPRIEVTKDLLTGALSTLKKKTPEEIEAAKLASAAKAAASAAARSGSPGKIKKFASFTAVGASDFEIARQKRLQVWRDEAQIAYSKNGIPVTKDLLTMGPDGWPIENDAAIAAAVALKSGMPGTSTSASIGTDTGVEDPTAKKAVLNADGSLFKKYNWDSRKLKQLIKESIVRVGADGRLYRRSADEINAERDAMAAAVAASPPKAGPSTVLSDAATAAVPASPAPHLTDAEVEAILSGDGRGKRSDSEIHAVGFPQDEWTPAQARKWLKVHDAVPIKGMRREGSWLRWRITPPSRYSRYTTKTLRSNGKSIHLVLGWR